MSKKSNDEQCGPGEILRKGYRRKGFQRNEYVKRDGTTIPATYVSAANVPPTCIKDVGKPGKGPKILPKPGNEIHLSRYGYSIHQPEAKRRQALRAAVNDTNNLLVLRRVNLIRNFQSNPDNKEKFSRDVEYLKKMYSNIRRTSIKKSKHKKQKGGGDYGLNTEQWYKNETGPADEETNPDDASKYIRGGNGDTSEQSDIVVNYISLPEKPENPEKSEKTEQSEIISIIDQEESCREGKCSIKTYFKEEHLKDGKKIIFETLDKSNVDDILKLNKECTSSKIDKNDVLKTFSNENEQSIGIKVDTVLEGYFHYKLINDGIVELICFCANKGYNCTLHMFMKKYFQENKFSKIIIPMKFFLSNDFKSCSEKNI